MRMYIKHLLNLEKDIKMTIITFDSQIDDNILIFYAVYQFTAILASIVQLKMAEQQWSVHGVGPPKRSSPSKQAVRFKGVSIRYHDNVLESDSFGLHLCPFDFIILWFSSEDAR